MTEAVLVLNAGSSSLKASLFTLDGNAALAPAARARVEGIGGAPRLVVADGDGRDGRVAGARPLAPEEGADHGGSLAVLRAWLADRLAGVTLIGAGHRVVHGGPDLARPVQIDEAVLERLEALVPLAPLHQPHNLAAIRALRALDPDLPQVACFDTAFHRGRPEVADLFALPYELYEQGVRRYGFHGLSYESILRRLPETAPGIAEGRLIVAHLGSGASLAAIRGGRSVDSSMSFTPLDGVPMGTRPGALDPGVVLHLMQARGLTADEVAALLYHRSGLRGLSGLSNDMRVLLESDLPRARLAVEHFVYRTAQQIAALAASLEGLDALVFTAGIGERSAEIRARIVARCRWLGIGLDPAANARHGPHISTPASAVSAWVIPTDEERVIADHTLGLLR